MLQVGTAYQRLVSFGQAVPAPLPTLRFRTSLQHQVFGLLVAEQGGAVAAADRLELVRDVLTAGGDVGEDAAERQIRIEPRATRSLEQARGQHAAALSDQRRVKLVCHPLAQR